ncbi:hypothetical protein MANY_22640 [Mycolicibacterium anyangense]|uniref:LysR substrate-binding domain-containing protein n=1 Tax=Mycolicibacterium anyangense TaxID=1431246 RepID=A0A6N4W9S7_9MYCO|nr:LysR substrate-binding domain-containing protein [Mycolicibacterium anyangense]BBZ76927.1 hypothetical protein MANY_22640 [Mycolicibacterium anyangense]
MCSLFRDAGLHREIMFELGQLADITRCAMHGLGSAIAPAAFAEGVTPGDAAVLAIDGIASTLRIAAYTRASRTEPLVDAALELFGSGTVPSQP